MQEPLPEGLFYLLLLDEIPSYKDVQHIANVWARRAIVPIHVFKAIDRLPRETHPMTQVRHWNSFSSNGIKFCESIRSGISKKEYWDPMYEDAMTLIARLPSIAAYIYRRTYKKGKHIEPNPDLDWAANFAHMLGFDQPDFYSYMRLFPHHSC
jgi:citrate synthase